MFTNRRPAGLAVALVLSLGLAACGGGAGSSESASSSAAGAGGGTVRVAKTDLGDILVDESGMTVYLFEKDANGTSGCAGECASAWPPLTVSASPSAGEGVDAAKLGTTVRADGGTQVTYNGHPLYRFSGDGQPGQAKGEGVDAFGAEWYAVSPEGNTVEKKSGGGYGGY